MKYVSLEILVGKSIIRKLPSGLYSIKNERLATKFPTYVYAIVCSEVPTYCSDDRDISSGW